jgi:hypothetical protein
VVINFQFSILIFQLKKAHLVKGKPPLSCALPKKHNHALPSTDTVMMVMDIVRAVCHAGHKDRKDF